MSKALFEAVKDFIDNSPTGDDDEPYCSDVAQFEFKKLVTAFHAEKFFGNPKPTHFTRYEGGPWIEWGKPVVAVHSVKFADGSEFDCVNGWRK